MRAVFWIGVDLVVSGMLLCPVAEVQAEPYTFRDTPSAMQRTADRIFSEPRERAFADINKRNNDIADRVGVPRVDNPATHPGNQPVFGFGVSKAYADWAAPRLAEISAMTATSRVSFANELGPTWRQQAFCGAVVYGQTFATCVGAIGVCEHGVGKECFAAAFICATEIATAENRFEECLTSP